MSDPCTMLLTILGVMLIVLLLFKRDPFDPGL